jgi:lysozyme
MGVQKQFNALVSFTYNEGIGALERSTLLQKLNMLDYAGTANQLLLWDKITDPKTGKKVVCKALTNRRKRERELFLKSLV